MSKDNDDNKNPLKTTLTKNPPRELSPEEIQAFEHTKVIIRPEINIEKFADFIFAPSHSRKLNRSRKKMWSTVLPDESKVSAYLLIEPPYGRKTPTTKTRKVYLALAKLWHERRSKDGNVNFSSREITQIIGIKWGGKKTARDIYDEILTLRATMFTWKFSFINAQGVKQQLLDHVNILDKFIYQTREERGKGEEQFQATSVIRFSESIQKNLEANRTKPTHLDAILSIKGEIASVLYARLDIIMAERDYYERRSKELFGDLNLEGEEEYIYPSHRKRKLEKAIKELNGKRISTGVLGLRLEKTADGKDWKLVVKNTHKLIISPPTPKKAKPAGPLANPSEMIVCLGEDIAEAIGSYDENRRLYETFARYYPDEVIYQAISEYKAEGQNAKHPVRFFIGILHRIAHQRGKEWIKPCPKDCKYRPVKK